MSPGGRDDKREFAVPTDPEGRVSSDKGEALPLWKNFSWTFAGTLVYTLCQWGMLSALSKLGTPQVVGQFALGLAITAPVVLFFNLQLRPVQATDSRGEYAFRDYLGLRMVTTLLALVLISVVVTVSGYRMEIVLVVLAVGAAKAFEALSDIFYGLLQRHERMDVVGRSMMIKGPLSLLALGLVFYVTGSLLWATVAIAATWAVTLGIYDIRKCAMLIKSGTHDMAVSLMPRWKLGILWRLTGFALPLGFVAALNSLNTNIPRYLTEQYLGERELGIFAALAYIMVSARLVSGALGNSASPRLSRFFAEGNRAEFNKLLFRLVLFGFSAGAIGVLASLVAGRWILSLLYTPEYAEYTTLFVWVMVATGLGYVTSILNFGIVATRRFRLQALTLVGVVGATSVACLILIPALGVVGAGMSLTLGTALYLVTNGMIIFRLTRRM